VHQLWYVAYGSNLSRERFCCYLRGGRADGNDREYPGCRDTSDPMDTFGLVIAGGVYFAGRSSGWRAGMAFLDPEVPGEVAARAYLITADQFVDVLAQETRRSPGMALDLEPAFRGERYSSGVGGYPILVRVGDRGDVPLMTFTRDWRAVATLAASSESYLAAMATGLREAHGWSSTQIDRYLSAIPGCSDRIQPPLAESVGVGEGDLDCVTVGVVGDGLGIATL
jgi:hypothetical protein